MSQLFKSILARSFLLHRAATIQTHQVRFPCLISLATPSNKRFFVSQTPPSKFGEVKANLDTSEVEIDDRPEIKIRKSFGYNKNMGSNNRFGGQREGFNGNRMSYNQRSVTINFN